MRNLRAGRIALGWALMGAAIWLAPARGGEDSEATLRKEFMKAYNGAPVERRVEAVKTLGGCREEPTRQMLIRVVSLDQEKTVRATAFEVLGALPETDPFLTGVLARGFTNEPDQDTKLLMAQALQRRQFKFEALREIVTFFITKCPAYGDDTVLIPANADEGKILEIRRKARKYCVDMLACISALASEHFVGHKAIREEVKGWWGRSSGTFLQQDRDLFKKIQDEAAAQKKAESDARKQGDAPKDAGPKP